MTAWIILTVIYLAFIFMAFAIVFVGGEADDETQRFFDDYERDQ